jgi:hypothetical protein
MKFVYTLMVLLLISCSAQKKISGNYIFKTECIGIEMDGSQTLRAWGKGRNRFDAVEQAKKNAVNDVLFKGIIDGDQSCEKRPLVPEVNARQTYSNYFNLFFSDNGEYLKYISLKDEKIKDRIFRDKKIAEQGVVYAVTIRVLRAQLQQRLIKDGILKTN